ncbi:MAG: GyrI-like domain-containing protein [Turicibacter sp.]|nr:GyrI-like domain-containing protein [Turicibacter sp.]
MAEIKLEERSFEGQKVIYLNATVPNEDLFIPFNMLSYLIKLPLHLFDKEMDPAVATGATYIKILHEHGGETDVEVCMPVDVEVPEGNGVFFKDAETVTGKFVTAYHQGPRDNLAELFGLANEWINDSGIKQGEGPVILSLPNNKHMVPESQLLTEIIFPVAE